MRVIIQIKESRKIKEAQEKINEIALNTKDVFKFQKNIDDIIKKNFGETIKKDNSWGVKLSIYFLTVTKSFNLDFFSKKHHVVFVKDLINCRSEVNDLNIHLKRIFK